MNQTTTYEILYRRYADVRNSFLQVRAGSVEAAMYALTVHVGDFHYTVTSIRIR
jgi:hypothetical protein